MVNHRAILAEAHHRLLNLDYSVVAALNLLIAAPAWTLQPYQYHRRGPYSGTRVQVCSSQRSRLQVRSGTSLATVAREV